MTYLVGSTWVVAFGSFFALGAAGLREALSQTICGPTDRITHKLLVIGLLCAATTLVLSCLSAWLTASIH